MLERLPLLISLLLAGALASVIYLQLQDLISLSDSPKASVNAASTSIVAPQPKKTERTLNIASLKLFGQPSQKPVQKEIIPDKLPKTNLKLTLTGVQAGELESESGALIEGPDRSTSYYKIGEQLPGNATLKRVFADRVVIERSGRLENLNFPEKFSNNNAITAVSQDTDAEQPIVKPAARPAAKPAKMDDARKQTIKNRLNKLRQRIQNNN